MRATRLTLRSPGVVAVGVAATLIGALSCGPSSPPTDAAARLPASALPERAALAPIRRALADAESTYYRSEFDSARSAFRSALVAADAAGDSVSTVRAMTWLGLTDYKQANYRSARTLGEQALALKLRLRLTRELPSSYIALGLTAYYEGRYADADTLFQQALDTARAVNDSVAMRRAVANQGLVWHDLGDFARARAAFQETHDQTIGAGETRAAGNALANLGMLEIRVGNPSRALRVLTEARALYDSIDYASGEEMALGQLAEAHAALGEPKLAFAYTDSALAIARRYGLRQPEVDGLRHKAALYFDAGDFQRALGYFEQARALASELGLQEVLAEIAREEARVLSALGELDLAAARAAEALRAHGDAGARFEQLADRLLVAELAHRAGHRTRMAAALRAAERESHGFAPGIAGVLVALTRARLADADARPEETLAALDAVRVDLTSVGPGMAAEAHALRARALARMARLREAADAGRQSVATLELVRRRLGTSTLGTSFTASRAAVYGDLAIVLLRLGNVEEALEIADAARGRALLEHLAAARLTTRSDTASAALLRGEELLTRIDDLVSRLVESGSVRQPERGGAEAAGPPPELVAELVAARRQYEELLMRAEQLDPRSTTLLGTTRLSVAEVRSVLTDDEVMLEYLATPERLLTFVVRRGGVSVIDTAATPEAIAARVRLARDLIGRNAANPAPPVLGALHELLVAPAQRRGLLTGARRIIVVPHGALAYLPFAALRDDRTGQYLVERYDVLVLPSGGALAALRRSALPASRLGRFDRADVAIFAPFPDALPGSRAEAREVARVMGRRARFGRDAGERAVRTALAERAVVHVATHAVLNGHSPMFSRLELTRRSAAPDDDGRFELHELLGARIASQLVFLSGCETGLGTAWSTAFLRGEDYTTMAQAFLQAGASNVVATLWRIEDRGAAEFAAAFYRALRDRSPVAALAHAQRELLRGKYSAPYYWAAYQVEGGGDATFTANRRKAVR